MHFLWTLLAGFVIAKMLTPGRDPKGSLITTGIGIAGSLIAKVLERSAELLPARRARWFHRQRRRRDPAPPRVPSRAGEESVGGG